MTAILAWSALAWGQTITASLEGLVKDPSGASIAGAQVHVTNTATNVLTRVTTDSCGRFVAPSLPPGPYAVTVEASGFKRTERSGIVLDVNQAARLDFTMELGTATKTVDVTATAPLLDTVHAVITKQDQESFAQLLKYVERLEPRTNTMLMKVNEIARKFPNDVIGVVTGHAHVPGIAEGLRRAGIGFEVISVPIPSEKTIAAYEELNYTSHANSLTTDAFERKQRGRSVDAPRSLGALLSGQRKPPPVIGTTWLRGKAEAYLLAAIIARAPLGDGPTLGTKALTELALLHYATLLPATLSRLGSDRIFQMRVQKENRVSVDIWVRTRAIRPEPARTLEAALNSLLAERHGYAGTRMPYAQVVDGVLALFSRDRAAVQNARLPDRDSSTP